MAPGASFVLVFQLDGSLPNLALLRVAAHHRARGEVVVFRRVRRPHQLQPHIGDPPWSRVYASVVFEKTRPLALEAARLYPSIILGGPSWDLSVDLEDVGVTTTALDYSDFPGFRSSIGYTQRGCRFNCSFCVVPEKEGRPKDASSIADIWRGDPWPREVVLLDNDFFGAPAWRARVDELLDGGFRVCLTQGINARILADDQAAALASLDYRANDMRSKRIYTAWDRPKDEARVFAGLELLARHGVQPGHLMVYTLIGFDPDETHEARDRRRRRLREFGALPYPMVYRRPGVSAEEASTLAGFQRWVVGSYDKRIPWPEFVRARWQPRNLIPPGRPRNASLLEPEEGHE